MALLSHNWLRAEQDDVFQTFLVIGYCIHRCAECFPDFNPHDCPVCTIVSIPQTWRLRPREVQVHTASKQERFEPSPNSNPVSPLNML